MAEKAITTISIDENKNITEKRYTVFLDGSGKEIARTKPSTSTINPGDPTQRYDLLEDDTKRIVDTVHKPEVIAAYRAKIAEILKNVVGR